MSCFSTYRMKGRVERGRIDWQQKHMIKNIMAGMIVLTGIGIAGYSVAFQEETSKENVRLVQPVAFQKSAENVANRQNRDGYQNAVLREQRSTDDGR